MDDARDAIAGDGGKDATGDVAGDATGGDTATLGDAGASGSNTGGCGCEVPGRRGESNATTRTAGVLLCVVGALSSWRRTNARQKNVTKNE
jgi:hypothetical protein